MNGARVAVLRNNAWPGFCEHVSYVAGIGDYLDLNLFVIFFFTYEVVLHVDTLCLEMKLGILHEFHRTGVVYVDHRCLPLLLQ